MTKNEGPDFAALGRTDESSPRWGQRPDTQVSREPTGPSFRLGTRFWVVALGTGLALAGCENRKPPKPPVIQQEPTADSTSEGTGEADESEQSAASVVSPAPVDGVPQWCADLEAPIGWQFQYHVPAGKSRSIPMSSSWPERCAYRDSGKDDNAIMVVLVSESEMRFEQVIDGKFSVVKVFGGEGGDKWVKWAGTDETDGCVHCHSIEEEHYIHGGRGLPNLIKESDDKEDVQSETEKCKKEPTRRGCQKPGLRNTKAPWPYPD